MLNIDFTKDYILENEWVRLTPLKSSDFVHLEQIAQEPNIWEHSFVKGDTLDNLKQYIQSTIDNREVGKEYPFLIFDKIQNQYAGCTRFYDFIPSLANVRLGYTWIGHSFRGTKVNKSCKFLLFEMAFEVMNAARVGLGAYKNNVLSIQAMKGVGCQEEGIFRSYLPYKNGRIDAVLLSILKEEWIDTKKAALLAKLRQ